MFIKLNERGLVVGGAPGWPITGLHIDFLLPGRWEGDVADRGRGCWEHQVLRGQCEVHFSGRASRCESETKR